MPRATWRRASAGLLRPRGSYRARRDHLKAAALVAFAGIGRPAKIFRDLARDRARSSSRTMAFPDHHRYARRRARRRSQREAEPQAPRSITTEKDWVRLAASWRAADRGAEGRDRLARPRRARGMLAPLAWRQAAWLSDRFRVCELSSRPRGVRSRATLLFRLLPLDGHRRRRLPRPHDRAAPRRSINARARICAAPCPRSSVPAIERIIRGMWDNLGRIIAEYPHLGDFRVYEAAAGSTSSAPSISKRQAAPGKARSSFPAISAIGRSRRLAVDASRPGRHRDLSRGQQSAASTGYSIARAAPIGSELVPKGAVAARGAIAALRKAVALPCWSIRR